MSQPAKVKFAIQGAIARVTLDRPEKLNALDPEMLTALEDAVTQAENSPRVRVIVLAAAGEKRSVSVQIFSLGQRYPHSKCGRNGCVGVTGFLSASSTQGSQLFALSKVLLMEGGSKWRSRATFGSPRTRRDLRCPK